MRKLEKICFVDNNDVVLLEKKLFSVPIKDEIIVRKSIYFFNDPEPCMIHRSAVLKLLLTELESFIDNMLQMDVFEIHVTQMPDSLRDYIDLPVCCSKMVLMLN